MSEVIIEEVDKNDLSESELAEFVQTEEIPVVNTDDEMMGGSFNSSEFETSDTENIAMPTTSTTPAKKCRPRSKKQISAAQLERSQSAFLKKFMNGEISYNDYVKRMENVSLDDGSLDEEDYDSDASNSTIRKVQKRTKRQTEKAETHHAKKIKRALPPALQGLMGQANLCFARGDTALAEKLCLEIIRQEPMAAEPYLTLSQIYEHTDEEKYKQLLLIAAHVNSTSIQWQQVAEIFLEKGNLQQASFCYAKATRCDPKNLSVRIKRLEILKQLGDEKHVLHCTYCMLGFIPKEDHKFLISQAKWVAKKYHEDGLVTKSLDAMLKAYSKVPEHFTTEDVHSFIELLVNNKQYRKCLQVLISHTGLQVKIIQKTKDTYEFSDLSIPEDMLIDLRTKMCICFIHLDAANLIQALVENVKKFIDVENSGDCYLDIAEALIAKSNYNDALKLLDPLVNSKAYSLAGVWLQHADCLRASFRFAEAIDSYKKVVELSQHIEARLTLAALLKQEGRMDEALNSLTEDYAETGIISTELLREKCLLLKELDRIDEYLQNGYTFLLRHCVHYRSRQEVQIVSNFTKTNDRLNELKNLRRIRDELVDDVDVPEFSKADDLTVSDDWNFFLELVRTAWKHKKYTQLQRITFAGMSSRRMQSHVREIDFMGVVACLFNREESFGYNKIREFHNTDKEKPRFWNLFNLIVYITQDTRFYRFVTRLFDRSTSYTINVPPLAYMMVANYCLLSNSYKYALNHYDEIYRRFKQPLVAMILGILYSQIANQKYTNRKQNLLVQAVNYMYKYAQTREPEAMAEIYYNTGRLYHQMGIVSVAKNYYDKALKETNPLIEKYPEILDLKREIAFNLHIIYKQSGNKFMARKMLYDYIVV